MGLIHSIAEVQAEKGWTDALLAEKLGIHKSGLSRIKQGHRKMNVEFLAMLGRVFPELRWQIAEYVFNGGEQ